MSLSLADARRLLVARAENELAEERGAPPSWAPFLVSHPIHEISAARHAARTRVAHTLALAEAPDRVLAGLLAAGWHPWPSHADNARYVNPSAVLPGRGLPR